MPSGSESRGPGNNNTRAKSAKAIKAAKNKGGVPAAKRGGGTARQIPWLTIGAVIAVVALIGVLAINIFPKYQDQQAVAKFTPSESNQDPSTAIDGVVTVDYPAGVHVDATQRVAYDQTPPFGGPHDSVWATCMGTVYADPIRTENAVHSLEHGAIWIAYNPDKIDDAQRKQLEERASSRDGYMLMSPYPGMDSPISLQSWGHQLEVDTADDERIDQFIAALRLNRYAYPEVGASCSTIPGSFDPANPPPFDAAAPGPDAVPMDGGGITPDASETGGGAGLPNGMQIPTELQQPAPATGGNG
ncbi:MULTISPECIES: DUF3105 domain-containing protein [unclassified Rhodococcus (in: high G+C Gram-positive bacteria)]|uniref:DUF3105 domain-containing protein n=1 Tax=unclassified Rhodococcus (in: high G+C Gram-positive bacteria) TaxID=192944 RepID=UPI000E0AFBE9|nr:MULTISPECIES: DUF3105 domain-containing protein [unclassified Rhodococcus (in: high G+C Gram-positive bacteria)]QKT11020.1 DUF3105 domain-containing protein [Rhodococcus sp. W8901]RDI23949.1 uncharacterized protein DUF3105 [Rhodococcus sp. AG1013]